MQRTKIFYLITSTNAGGTERALGLLLQGLDRQRFAPVVCSIKSPGLFARQIADRADAFHTLGLPEAGGVVAGLLFLPALLRLVVQLRRSRPDVLHAFLFRANLMGRIAARVAGVPVVISSIRVIEPRCWYRDLADRLTAPLVTRYTAVSAAAARDARQRLGLAPGRIMMICNGIDTEDARAQAAGGDAPRRADIVLAGRFDKQKGHAMLLAALPRLVSSRPGLRVCFYGTGPEEHRLRAMTRRLGLQGTVVFCGVADNIFTCLAAADVVVLPSLWEGFPNVLLEALAVGRPVVASAVPGIDEIVEDGVTGVLCPPGCTEALAGALELLLQDPARARAMGERGRAHVAARFSLRTMVAATERLYAALVTETRD